MRLYFRPGVCSLSPHIVLREAGLPFTLENVNRETRLTASGVDLRTKNPKNVVPTLELDNGEILTEGAAMVQYIADQKPESKLAPRPGTMERYRLIEWLNYIATEMHKGFSPLFSPKINDEYRAAVRDALSAKLTYLDGVLAGKSYLTGENFTIADAYLFTILRWSPVAKLDIATFPNVKAYHDRIAARPAVTEALAAEKAAA